MKKILPVALLLIAPAFTVSIKSRLYQVPNTLFILSQDAVYASTSNDYKEPSYPAYPDDHHDDYSKPADDYHDSYTDGDDYSSHGDDYSDYSDGYSSHGDDYHDHKVCLPTLKEPFDASKYLPDEIIEVRYLYIP